MSSWWRRYVESVGVTSSGKSWRRTAMIALGLSRETLAEYSGPWDRRIVEHFGTDITVGPWARRLGNAEPVTNGIINENIPVMHEGVRVVHNG